MYKLQETSDYQGLAAMFYANGLEFPLNKPLPAGLIKCWEVIDDTSGRRIGGVEVEKRAGEYVIGGITVEKDYRKQDLGTLMMKAAIKEIQSLGAKKVMLIAKVPEFFRTMGFVAIDMADSPPIFKCAGCDSFNVTCFPQVMYLDL